MCIQFGHRNCAKERGQEEAPSTTTEIVIILVGSDLADSGKYSLETGASDERVLFIRCNPKALIFGLFRPFPGFFNLFLELAFPVAFPTPSETEPFDSPWQTTPQTTQTPTAPRSRPGREVAGFQLAPCPPPQHGSHRHHRQGK